MSAVINARVKREIMGIGVPYQHASYLADQFGSGQYVTAADGSAPRTLADWFTTPAIDIRRFGEIYADDSSKDDQNTAVFQSALDSAQRVLVPAGRFYLNPIKMVTGSQLIGVGRPQQFSFNPANGTVLDFLHAPEASDGVYTDGTAQMIYLADMQIQRAPRHGANLTMVYSAMDRVTFAYNGDDGLHFVNTYLSRVSNCFFEFSGGNGFDATSDGTYTTLSIDACESMHNTGNGYHVSDHNSTRFSNCGADHNGGYGYEIVDADVAFISTDAERNDKSGFFGSGAKMNFMGCTAATNVEDEGEGEANFLRMTGSKAVVIGCHDLALNHTTISVNVETSSTIYQIMNDWLGTEDVDMSSTSLP